MLPRLTFFLLLLALLFPSAAVPAAEESRRLDMIVTGELARLYPSNTANEELQKAPARLEALLKELRTENPDALLIDSGNHYSFTAGLETAYGVPVLRMFDDQKFDVVNLRPRDAALATGGNTGYNYTPKEFLTRPITSLRLRHKELLPAFRTVQSAKGGKVTFASASTAQEISGWSAKMLEFQENEPAATAQQIATAPDAAGAPVVVFSNRPVAQLAPLKPALVFAANLRSEKPEQDGDVWRVPTPRGGEVMVVQVPIQGGVFGEPKLQRRSFLKPEEFDALHDLPAVTQIGWELPNLDDVLRQFFGVGQGRARADRIALPDVEKHTSVAVPYVYTTEANGKTYRFYRVLTKLPNYQRPGFYISGWPQMDMLVVLDAEGNFLRIESRGRFPVGGVDSSIYEALNRLGGKDPATWAPDPELVAGLEDAWGWPVHVLRKTLALDAALRAQHAAGAKQKTPPAK